MKEHFDPERFASACEENKKDFFALIGFSGGEHLYIGIEFAKMEMKIFLATLLQQYNWSVTPKHAINNYHELLFQVEEKFQVQLKVFH